MRELLHGVLPRLLPPEMAFICITHEGRSDLLHSLPLKLRNWHDPQARFIVVCDQDSSDCHALKAQIATIAAQAGRGDTLVRIVCRELEAWLFGDLAAVELGLGVTGLAALHDRRRFRTPDTMQGPAKQLREVAPTYQKMAGCRAIGPHLRLDGNRSHSFGVFIAGVRRVVDMANVG